MNPSEPREDFQPRGASGGAYTAAAKEELRQMFGDEPVTFLTTSCTAALEMAGILCDIRPGDEVIVPSFGFVTTALAFVRAGASIRFADVEPGTLGLDPDSVQSHLSPRTKAVVPIHYGGIPARMSALAEVLQSSRAMLVEDAAHGLGGTFDRRPLGTIAPLAALSFHATKNFSCGEGGALVVNDERLVDRARIVFEKGTDRSAFLDGTVDKYTWLDLGSSFGLSDYLAERLVQELRNASFIQSQRRLIHEVYDEMLADAGASLGFRTPTIPDGSTSAYHLYYVLLERAQERDQLLQELRSRGVNATFHYVPLHDTPGGKRWGSGDCPVSEKVAGSIVRLPLRHTMTVSDAQRNAEVLLDLMRTNQ